MVRFQFRNYLCLRRQRNGKRTALTILSGNLDLAMVVETMDVLDMKRCKHTMIYTIVSIMKKISYMSLIHLNRKTDSLLLLRITT
nr:MAG TPA: hypothetical protein [Caudoviricetes sp.]